MKEYYFANDEFVIENYDKQRTFTSFLPAIAGKKGIPMWAFYVNRGQIMSSFGVKDKNGAILEFFPAYTAYEIVSKIGFRTFIKLNNKVYECFKEESRNISRKMLIKKHEVSIVEENKTLGLSIKVTYFTMPNENYASLIRKVCVSNLDDTSKDIEIIDGLSQLFTPGTEHGTYKVMSNLLRSWMDVMGLETNSAYYKLRASTNDSAEVTEITIGNFYLSMVDNKRVKPIVDPVSVFGYDTSYEKAVNFIDSSVDQILSNASYPVNKVLCGFTGTKLHFDGKQSHRIDTIIGQSHSYDSYLENIDKMSSTAFIDAKQLENAQIIDSMTKDVETKTSNQLFNEYIESTFLDNMLRGGYPYIFKDNKGNEFIYYLFSRKHGDPERDYNWFNIENEFYSQGNGNFRDICQNRRNDSLLNTSVKEYNLKYFMNLVQLDGYNPLGVNGATFTLKDDCDVNALVKANFKDKNDIMKNLLSGKFTPGSIVNVKENNKIESYFEESKFLANIFDNVKSNIEATFNEGYWCDHFDYLLDLYESYISVYPDNEMQVLFDDVSYSYFESPCFVQPRYAKTCLTPDNKVRQYGALYEHDDLKIKTFNLNPSVTNWAKTSSMEELKTNLISKYFVLAFNKFNLLDNQQIGIEMEGGKPGWNDACNGLPGLFGSGVSETFELKRIINMLSDAFIKYPNKELILPVEFVDFVFANVKLLNQKLSSFEYYDASASLREQYREVLRTGVSKNMSIKCSLLNKAIKAMDKLVSSAIEKAHALGNGIYPTFLTYEVTKYKKVVDKDNNVMHGYNNYELVLPLEYKLVEVPKFLEGPARSLKVVDKRKYNLETYQNVKNSDIYDKNLKMYKTSESLDSQSNEFGRIRAFSKGWLERESNFMHMTYKYMYGLLNAKLYKQFYVEAKTNMVCNMNPKVYGRSPLEHCSFIATSNNPDRNVHGQGFVSRLSGSTAEMLSIYLYMMIGKNMFIMENDKLKLNLCPVISKELFKEDKTLSFKLLSSIEVTYVNENMIDTYKGKVVSYELINVTGSKVVKEVIGDDAYDVRNGKYNKIVAIIK